jgi:uncharacterized protein YndB with AHSA1/START domain
MTPPGDTARVTVFVKVEPEVAFDVFTREIDLWWRRGPKFRHSGRHAGQLTIEEGVGGRIFETFRVGSETKTFVVGEVMAWEPPSRLQFSWRNSNFAPHERTEVEIRFSPWPGGTQVAVEHRGWSALPPDHPARHGQKGAEFIRMIGMWWSEVLLPYRERLT